jgi:hypothetical protein
MNPVDPFENVSEPNFDSASAITQTSPQALSNIATISVGSGTNVLRFDQNGLFMGANTFVSAPFSVSIAGVITSQSIQGGNVITIDGGNARIIGNDGTNNRLVIGNV